VRAWEQGADARNRPGGALIVAFLVLFVAALVSSAHALTLPPLSGRVVDEAGVLDSATRAALTQKLADLEAKTTDQLVVVTLPSLQGTSIEELGVALGRAWQIGQKGKNNGVLLIVAPNERKVRIEVGYGLEGTLTDAVSRLIIANAIVPRFQQKDFAGGIGRGVDDIVAVLTGDAEEWKSRAAQRPDETPAWGSLLTFVLIFAVILVVFFMIGAASPPATRRRGRYSPWIGGPGPFWNGSSGGFSGGGGFGGGSSGGGFSGGGVSFGGGGSSGSW
jgi:uncharacterized protein